MSRLSDLFEKETARLELYGIEKAAPDSPAKAFMDDVKVAYEADQSFRKSLQVYLTYKTEDEVELTFILTTDHRESGLGGRALKMLGDLADKNKVNLTGQVHNNPKIFGRKTLPKDKLTNWYLRHGFQLRDGSPDKVVRPFKESMMPTDPKLDGYDIQVGQHGFPTKEALMQDASGIRDETGINFSWRGSKLHTWDKKDAETLKKYLIKKYGIAGEVFVSGSYKENTMPRRDPKQTGFMNRLASRNKRIAAKLGVPEDKVAELTNEWMKTTHAGECIDLEDYIKQHMGKKEDASTKVKELVAALNEITDGNSLDEEAAHWAILSGFKSSDGYHVWVKSHSDDKAAMEAAYEKLPILGDCNFSELVSVANPEELPGPKEEFVGKMPDFFKKFGGRMLRGSGPNLKCPY